LEILDPLERKKDRIEGRTTTKNHKEMSTSVNRARKPRNLIYEIVKNKGQVNEKFDK
jgi:hypothetical protein